MDERIVQLRVGIVVVCSALIVGILIFLFGEGWTSQYTLYVESPTAPGVTQNTPIRKHGVHVGRVSNVELKEDMVRLTLKINGNEKIYVNDICEIGTASLLGDAVLDFKPGKNPGSDLVEEGALLSDNQVFVARSPFDILDIALKLETPIAEALASIKNAGDRVDAVGSDIQSIAGAITDAFAGEEGDAKQFFERFKQLSVKAESAVDNFNKMTTGVNQIVNDVELRDNIKKTAAKLPELLTEAESAMKQATDTIASFEDVGKKLDSNLDNLSDFTKALGEDGPEITRQLRDSMGSIDELIEQINSMVGQVSQFVNDVNNSDGSLKKLVSDPQLYNNVNQTVRNLNDTVRNVKQLTIQLQPLLNDIRYIADGAARSPGSVIRDVFDKKPKFSGFKGSNVGQDRVDYR